MKSLFFDAMVTPKIITFIYWLLLFVAGHHHTQKMTECTGGAQP